MPIRILSHKGLIGSFQARVIDESMGVSGEELEIIDLYNSSYQDLYRKHTLKPTWSQIELVGLKAITEMGYKLSQAGGIGIMDLKEFPNEITTEVCGLSPNDIALTMAG